MDCLKKRKRSYKKLECWESETLLDEVEFIGPSDFGSINENTQEQQRKGSTDTEMAQNKYEIWGMPLIAEFVGQLLFAFFHCMSAATEPPIASAFTDGLFVSIMVITIGGISGAHVNSAVTVAVALTGGMKWVMLPLYIVVQLVGSIAGAGLAYVAFGSINGAFELQQGMTLGQGVLTETLITLLLIFTVLMAAVDQGSILAAFGIGLSILIGIFAGNQVTGACMNPSLSFGPAVISGKWTNYWIYWVGPLLGALIAVALVRLGLGSRQKRVFCKENGETEDSTAMEGRAERGTANKALDGEPDQSQM